MVVFWSLLNAPCISYSHDWDTKTLLNVVKFQNWIVNMIYVSNVCALTDRYSEVLISDLGKTGNYHV